MRGIRFIIAYLYVEASCHSARCTNKTFLNVILFPQLKLWKKKRGFINLPVIIFAENPIEIKKKAKISFLLEILLKMKNEKMKKKYDSLLE